MKTKNIIIALAAIIAAVMFTSCNKQDETPAVAQDELGNVSLRVNTGDAATKANSLATEATLTDVQVFLFNTADELYRYYTLSTDEKTDKLCTISNIKTGTYSMYVVANGPDMSTTVHNKSELLNTSIELGAYNDRSVDFVMGGYVDGIVVNADQTTDAPVSISRYVSRVTISLIRNGLPESFGSMTVNYAVLDNVVGNQKISGSDPASLWYNKDGRADEATRDAGHIIGTSTYEASAPQDTWIAYNQVVTNGSSINDKKYFYGYPNSLTTRGSGFQSSYSPVATCLDLSITFNVGTTAHTYYYNVPLQGTSGVPGIARNYDYDVKITILGEGADEPGKYTEKGNIKTTITVLDWTDGAPLTPEI